MTTLDIYIAENCWSCGEAVRIVNEITPRFPEIQFSLLDLKTHSAPEEVFAVPTYVINGKVAFLGNPTLEQLVKKLEAVRQEILTID